MRLLLNILWATLGGGFVIALQYALGGLVLLIPFCVYAVVVSVPTAVESIQRHEVSPDPGGLLRWPIKAVLPVAFVLLALQGVANTMRAVAVLTRGGTR